MHINQIKFEALGPALDTIESEIHEQVFNDTPPTKKNKIAWGGANVIVSERPVETYVGDFVLITPHADAVAWFLNRVRSPAYDSGLIDYLSKFDFFKRLASAAAAMPSDASAQELLLHLLAVTKKISVSWDNDDADR